MAHDDCRIRGDDSSVEILIDEVPSVVAVDEHFEARCDSFAKVGVFNPVGAPHEIAVNVESAAGAWLSEFDIGAIVNLEIVHPEGACRYAECCAAFNLDECVLTVVNQGFAGVGPYDELFGVGERHEIENGNELVVPFASLEMVDSSHDSVVLVIWAADGCFSVQVDIAMNGCPSLQGDVTHGVERSDVSQSAYGKRVVVVGLDACCSEVAVATTSFYAEGIAVK